MLHNILRHKK